MWQNTKLLTSVSILIIFFGLGFLWFGIKSPADIAVTPSPVPIVESNQEATISGLPVVSGTQGIAGEKAQVTEVVDGDTIKVSLQGKQQTVRFVGIDTPETVDPRRPVGCFGKEASNEVKGLLTGKVIILQKDISDTDKYKRLLRYIYLPLEDGQILFVNDYLVRAGFAKVYIYPPDTKFDEQFKQAEKQAKVGKIGLWGKC